MKVKLTSSSLERMTCRSARTVSGRAVPSGW
jgi:hypothetical protein